MSDPRWFELGEVCVSSAGTVLAAWIAARQHQVKRRLTRSNGELEGIRRDLEELLRSRRRD